ncbi:MAG: ABC transporter ATP-binding protein [Solirubrobacteraceae bacterium]
MEDRATTPETAAVADDSRRGRGGARAASREAAEPAVEVQRLVKRYAKATANAVDGISFSVARGEVFALLGPNGAGKTTTIGMLTTRIRPDSGVARIAGVDVAAQPVLVRSRLAVVPQRSNLDRSLSIRNNLVFHAAYHGVPRGVASERADALLAQFGLAERAAVKPDLFSGGQAQRVMIARALMHRPEVLFLDEPSTGLDPAARLFVWDRLGELEREGVTLILTTHDMAEAAELSDRVAIIDHGSVLALDTPERLIRSLPGSTTLELTATAHTATAHTATAHTATAHTASPPSATVASTPPAHEPAGAQLPTASGEDAYARLLLALEALDGVERVERIDSEPGASEVQLRLRLYISGEAPPLIVPAAGGHDANGASLAGVEIGAPTLEDVFIHLTGRTLR